MPTVPQIGLSPPAGASLPLTPMPSPGTNSPQALGKSVEGMFASMLLKQMRQSVGGGNLFGSDKSDALGGLFDQFMGQHMASSGGLGIGAMVRRQLELRSATHAQQQPQHVPAAYTHAATAVHRPSAAGG